MTASTQLQPWRGIRFYDGTRISYQPPRDTLDNRFAACTRHHPACDCREAELNENLHEYRAELDQARQAFAEVLHGHNTWAWDPVTGDPDPMAQCKCTGCEIARRTHMRPSYIVSEEREAAGAPVYSPLWSQAAGRWF